MEKFIQNLLSKKNLKRRGHFVDFRKDPREILYEGVKWVHLTQDRVKWEAFIKP
jgi:hypothetical protein